MPIFQNKSQAYSPQFIFPQWPVAKHIRAVSTTRHAGFSQAPFDGFNLATHVGDDLSDVIKNRQLLSAHLKLPHPPFWLDQRHTVDAIELTSNSLLQETPPIADASWTTETGQVCLVMTADCLPILLTNRQGSFVCAIHAGWKGLAEGIIEKTLAKLPDDPANCLAWIGPAIGPEAFEVGQDVYQAFTERQAATQVYFKPEVDLQSNSQPKYRANLPVLAKFELNRLGVKQVYGGERCTFKQSEDFFSYRRERKTGRIASLIWMEARD